MNKEKGQLFPEARKEGLIVQELSDEVLVYDRERDKAHCLNQTAALIWRRCDGKKSIAQISASLETDLKFPVDDEIVQMALDQLSKSYLLERRAAWPADRSRVSRREVMRRIGWAAAVGLPLVTSIVAPRAVEAVTCAINCAGSPANCIATPGCPPVCSGTVCTP